MSVTPHKPSFNLNPFVLLAGSLSTGVLLTKIVNPPPLFCLALGAALSTLAIIALKRNSLTRAAFFIVLAFASAGASLALAEEVAVDDERVRRFYEDGRIDSGEPVEITGALERAPEVAPDGLRMSLRVERLKSGADEYEAKGRVEFFAPTRENRLRDEYDALELRRGARLRAMVGLERDAGFRNPGVSPYTEFLDRRDADARGVIKSPLLIERLDDERVFLPLVWLEERRAQLLSRFEETFSPETASVLAASMLGNRHHLSRETSERFREGGTFHVLVISGVHITFIGGLFWAFASRLTKRPALRWAASCVAVWVYAVGVGAETSVVRAALMFTFVALAPALSRPAATLNALGGAALFLLVLRPSNLFDPSFQLSFLSVLAIVALAWPLYSRLKEIGEWRPTRSTPYPPACPSHLRTFAEALFWSERAWLIELRRSTYSYRLFKTTWAVRLERLRLQKLMRFAFAALLTSVSVQLFMLPLLALHFHRLSLASLVLNVFVGALMAILSFAALAAVSLAQLGSFFSDPFIWIAEWANALMVRGVDPFSRIGLASVRIAEYAGLAKATYFLHYLPLASLIVALARWSPLAPPSTDDEAKRRRRLRFFRLSALASVVLFVLIVTHPFSAPRPDGKLRVDFLDVGQGDAALITAPNGRTLLIDGGGRPRISLRGDEFEGGEEFERDSRTIGEAVVSEYLWHRGLSSIDFMLATHADADHIEGLNDVARNFNVGAALVARTPENDEEFERLAGTLQSVGVPVYAISRGDSLRFGGVEIDALWPAPEKGDASSSNDDSVVLRVRFGSRSILFTGDIEAKTEGALVALEGDALRSDVVKVAHHGSRTSSMRSFVEATRPAYAVVSVGRDSPYGHPHAQVIERWRAIGARVVTTGESGAIFFTTDGDDLRMETYVRQRDAQAVESQP